MSISFEDLKEFDKPYVHINDKEAVLNKINQIIAGGADHLQIVSDFDMTITKHHENGKKHLSSFGMMNKCPSTPQWYVENEKKLYDRFHPIEIDSRVPFEEKRKHMEEWWKTCEKCLTGLSVPLSEFEYVVKEFGPTLRDGTKELMLDLYNSKVPALVFSAGLGDAVEAVLKYHDVLYPNVKVVSNYLKYEDGKIAGFKSSYIITVCNKNELALEGTNYHEIVEHRDNIILMGDSLGDATMADGVPKCNAMLKIGFLHDHAELHLPAYMKTFDIVLVDDQTMDIVRAVLKHVLK